MKKVKKESICFYDIESRYSGKVEGTFPKIERNLLEAAQSYLRGGSFAVHEGSLSRKDRLLARRLVHWNSGLRAEMTS